jgi:hypothetical protein
MPSSKQRSGRRAGDGHLALLADVHVMRISYRGLVVVFAEEAVLAASIANADVHM